MSKICELHDHAMLLMNEAFSLKAKKDIDTCAQFLLACEYEAESAYLVEKKIENEPSRGMLFLGAASLAWNGQDYEQAERLVAEGLSGFPTERVKTDLRKLLDDIKFSMATEKATGQLDEAETEIRLYGNEVGFGRISAHVLIQKIDAIEKIISRTTQRKYGLPFEKHPKSRDGHPEFNIDIEWAEAGSFGLKIKLSRKRNEPISLLQPEAKDILSDVISSIELINTGKIEKLKEHINNEDYLVHFISQAKELAPDGKNLSNIGFITQDTNISLKNNRKKISTILKENIKKEFSPEERIQTFRGYLRVSDGLRDEFIIKPENTSDDISIKIKVRDALDELAKKYFGDLVEATCEKKGKFYHLIDISPAH